MLTLLRTATQKSLFKFDLRYVSFSQSTIKSDSKSKQIDSINERKIDFDKAYLAS